MKQAEGTQRALTLVKSNRFFFGGKTDENGPSMGPCSRRFVGAGAVAFENQRGSARAAHGQESGLEQGQDEKT